jgi:hypothetical protein
MTTLRAAGLLRGQHYLAGAVNEKGAGLGHTPEAVAAGLLALLGDLAGQFVTGVLCLATILKTIAPPSRKYLKYPSKWLEASVYRSLPEGTPDRWVLAIAADTGPDLLRSLREALTAVAQVSVPTPRCSPVPTTATPCALPAPTRFSRPSS